MEVVKDIPDASGERWALLNACVESSFFGDAMPGNQTVYGLAENLMAECVQRKRCPVELVDLFKTNIRTYCETAVQNMSKLEDSEGWEGGLEAVAKIWTRFTMAMRTLKNVFDGVESQYMVTRSPGSIWNLGVGLFRTAVLQCGDSFQAVVKLVLRALNAYRSSDLALGCDSWVAPPVSRVVLIALQMFSLLNVYDNCLEKAVIDDARVFYTNQGQVGLKRADLADYLCELERRSLLEVSIGKHMKESTAESLIGIFKEKMLRDHVISLLAQPRLVELVEIQNVVALSRAYRLFNDIDQHAIRNPWNAYIKDKGTSLLGLEDGTVVHRLIEFKDQLQSIRKTCFGDESFYSAKDSFESFLNQDPSRAAMLLAGHFGVLLEDELEKDTLTVVMDLFRYIQAKDIFEAYFRKDLHRRLLSKTKISEQELEVIDALRLECGSGFTAKIDGMIRDMQASVESGEEYKRFLTSNKSADYQDALRIEFTPVVLTSGYWPTSTGVSEDWTANIPTVGSLLTRLHAQFKDMYFTKHSKRTLKWIPSWGTCIVRTTFQPGSKKTLLISHAQASVLFLFEETDTLTCQEIYKLAGMSEADGKKVIQSLCLQKNLKVLLKGTKTRSVQEGEKFTFNSGFKHSKNFVVLNNAPVQNPKEDLKQTEERVQEVRQYELDALIVRMMKSKRSMTHNDLMAEVLKVATFKPQPSDVKKRVENLILRDYISRDPMQSDHYNYVA